METETETETEAETEKMEGCVTPSRHHSMLTLASACFRVVSCR